MNSPTVVFVLGCIGAGKSHYIEHTLSQMKPFSEYAIVIFDQVMIQLESYKDCKDGIVISWPPEQRSPCYLEALTKVDEEIDRLVAHRQSFIVEGAGTNVESNVKAMLYQKSLGYKIIIHHIATPPSIAKEQVIKRNAQPENIRYVTPELSIETYARLQVNLQAYMEIADEFVSISRL